VDGEESGARKKRRKSEGERAEGKADSKKTELKIQPGETIAHFNRRVEDAMRPEVRSAMKASSSRAKKVRKEEEAARAEKVTSSKKDAPSKRDAGDENPAPESAKKISAKGKERAVAENDDQPKDFQRLSTSAPRRLNDIVQAPPELKKPPRGVAKIAAAKDESGKVDPKSLKEGVMSMAQKAMMEEERLRVVKLYREMKKANMAG